MLRSLSPVAFTTLLLVLLGSVDVALAAPMPEGTVLGARPGDVFREIKRVQDTGGAWRVTGPDAGAGGAKRFLPNPKLDLTIEPGMLQGATRAELIIDYWGGHPGTEDPKFRVNENEWLPVPPLETLPADVDQPLMMRQYNPVVPIPLAHLQEGENIFEGTACCTSWPQWGWRAFLLRIYYSPAHPHPTGQIVTPQPGNVLGADPTIEVSAQSAVGVKRVDVIGYYEGIDENGDGIYTDWHASYFNAEGNGSTLEDFFLDEHIGTTQAAPYQVTWDTTWIPDQAPGTVKLIARVEDENGIFFVTQPVENLSLAREGSVRLYRSRDVPQRYWVRAGSAKSNPIDIPSDAPLAEALGARLYVRTWNGANNGHHEYIKLGSWSDRVGGKNHLYALTHHDIPTSALAAGGSTVEVKSNTSHHGMEVMWPGPMLVVRYSTPSDQNAGAVNQTRGQQQPQPAPQPRPRTGPCHLLTHQNAEQLPAGYAAPWNVFSGVHELLIKTTCLTDGVQLEIGTGNNLHYVYGSAFFWSGTAWQEIALTSQSQDASGSWHVGRAQARLPAPQSGTNFVVGYMCIWRLGGWQCGCRDEACAQPRWQVQVYRQVVE